MLVIDELLKILTTLLGENGCAWDKEQTLRSMRSSLLEESCEAIDAIDSAQGLAIEEELGDLLFNSIFICLLAEKEGYTTFQGIVKMLNDKLIYRHPHIFGKGSHLSTSEEVLQQWDRLKALEVGKSTRESSLDGIPKALPALARAQKVFRKMKKQGFIPDLTEESSEEALLGSSLFKLVIEAENQSIEAEFALRQVLDGAEALFRMQEKK